MSRPSSLIWRAFVAGPGPSRSVSRRIASNGPLGGAGSRREIWSATLPPPSDGWWAENVQGLPSRYAGHGPELAATKEEVLELLDLLHTESTDIIARLTPEQLQSRCTTVGGIDVTVWKWLRLMVEHEIHHRGQLYEVLGQLGVETPPLYGLTEPEVEARSEPRESDGG